MPKSGTTILVDLFVYRFTIANTMAFTFLPVIGRRKSTVSGWNDAGQTRVPDSLEEESPTRSICGMKNQQYDVDKSDCSSVDTRPSLLSMDGRPDMRPPSAHSLSRVSPIKERNLRFVSDEKAGDVHSHCLKSTSDSRCTSSSDESKGGESLSISSKPSSRNAYGDSSRYIDLDVSDELRQVFQYIEEYKPTKNDLDISLKCFIPEYKPAIGEPDAFLKMPRPDGEPDRLGLKVLDKPTANQSDAAVVELQLRTLSKKRHHDTVVVRTIENASKNPMEIENFVNSMKNIHREPIQVDYKKPVPTIEKVLEPWPQEFEQAIRDGTVVLPDPNMDLSLEEYAQVLCSLLDIPVHDGNQIQSLHLMCEEFIESQSNPVSH